MTPDTIGRIESYERYNEVLAYLKHKGDEDAANALKNLIWDTQVKEKKKIKPDDRTGLFFYMNASEERHL